MKRNARLLNKAADRIEEFPESYSQQVFRMHDDSAPCGTIACLAGEIVIASERSVKQGVKKLWETAEPDETAKDLAGLTEDEADRLFAMTSTFWPEPYRSQYEKATTDRGRAKAASGVLRYTAKGGRI